VTELEVAYQRLRDGGCRHGEAIDKLALKLGLDVWTVKRSLVRAVRKREPSCSAS
jgi:hypothetical protein